MNQNTCRTCEYFCQHYTFSKGRIHRVFCGHCTAGKVKTKRPYAVACEKYNYSEPDEDAFVSKEYLSKELLQHVLNMDLLPKIEDYENTQKKHP